MKTWNFFDEKHGSINENIDFKKHGIFRWKHWFFHEKMFLRKTWILNEILIQLKSTFCSGFNFLHQLTHRDTSL